MKCWWNCAFQRIVITRYYNNNCCMFTRPLLLKIVFFDSNGTLVSSLKSLYLTRPWRLTGPTGGSFIFSVKLNQTFPVDMFVYDERIVIKKQIHVFGKKKKNSFDRIVFARAVVLNWHSRFSVLRGYFLGSPRTEKKTSRTAIVTYILWRSDRERRRQVLSRL